MTRQDPGSRFFLPNRVVSGNSVALRGRIMAALGKGTLAAALATAMAVMPSFAQNSGKVDAKPAPEAKVSTYNPKDDVITLAGDYSEEHPVVAIGILKGQKETKLTGEQVGEALSNVLMKAYDGIPSKVFVAPGGDYTAIVFAVKGHIYGPYGLKESLSSIALAADSYNEVVRPRTPIKRGSEMTAKPEQHHE
jgi:hypothetical protein